MSNEIQATKAAAMQQATPSAIVATPDALLERALESGNLDIIKQFMDLKDREEAKQARIAFTEAMSGFRSECPEIFKGRKGHNCTYAGLAETISQIKGLLTKYGLSHSWKTETNGTITVTCVVQHILGHQESTSLTANADKSGSKNDVQALGSTITYLQRYTLYAILGLASTDQDDDGSAAGSAFLTDEQVQAVFELIQEIGTDLDLDKFLKFAGADAVEHIPAAKFNVVMSALQRKKAKGAA